ncbi:MAG: exodeoxyribonuclease VII large subunit [Thermomicrobiales bacterium]|nr:exodeoxyribonuclease VII large subunit [Thermomicrobiales bacterium]
MTARVVPVSLLASYIRQLFDADPVLSDIWVEGEVSQVFTSRAGHVYFTLRDADNQLKAVIFKGLAQRQRSLPRVGDQVAAHGRVSTYERDGIYQLYVDVIEQAGQGLLALQFEQLRQKLEADGLFDESRKRPVPEMPLQIGVVTSAEGAVWHDIQHVMRRRFPLAHLILSPAPVQGIHAPAGIIAALDRIQQDGRAELVIVARGGGSAEDLACFNDERVARAVFACRVPVISAVGHETDWTIIDLVADLRAPTPSAAAELCSPSIDALLEDISASLRHARSIVRSELQRHRKDAATLGWSLEGLTPASQMQRHRNEIGRLALALGTVPRGFLPAQRTSWSHVRESLDRRGRTIVSERRSDLIRYDAVLDALSPSQVIARGYAVLESKETGALITSIRQAQAGHHIIAKLRDGRIDAVVQRVDGNAGVGHNDGT